MDEEPPLPPASPAPPASRLRRTLRSLRAPFRPGSPFHLGTLHRSGSNKSSASDGDLARAERNMRKRNKKNREPASDASRSTDSSPSVDKKKKDGFMRRMGSIGKKKAEESTSAPAPSPAQLTRESTLESDSAQPPEPTPAPAPAPAPAPPPEPAPETAPAPVPELIVVAPAAPEPEPEPVPEPEMEPEPSPEPPRPEPIITIPEPVSPIAVERPIATRPFAKAAWQRTRSSQQEMENPVERPSPESADRRRVAFVGQAGGSEEGVEGAAGARGGVGSLEEAVALARGRLAARRAHSTAPTERCARDDMPAYGDLIEPTKPGSESVSVPSRSGSEASSSERCARAMSLAFEEAGDDCYLTVCECCGFSAETTVLSPSHASPSGERREHLYKILVIGELGTGKTSIIKRYVHQFFSQHYRATIGVDFALKVLNWDANTVIRLQLWDIAGQERFGNMTRVYYKEAVGAFIVFDVSRVATFDAVVKWKNDLDAKVQLPDGSPIPCILLANKCDQQKEGLISSAAKMEEYCKERGFAGWFETSAKENVNIEEAARSLVNKILLNDKLLQSNDKDGEKFALEHKIANGENSRNSSGKSCNC